MNNTNMVVTLAQKNYGKGESHNKSVHIDSYSNETGELISLVS